MLDVHTVLDASDMLEIQEIQEPLDIVDVMEGTTIRRYLRKNGGEKQNA